MATNYENASHIVLHIVRQYASDTSPERLTAMIVDSLDEVHLITEESEGENA